MATVSHVTDAKITLVINNTSLTWPRSEFQHVSVGDIIYLVPFTKAGLEEERNEVAKALLNSVLNPSHDNKSQGE